ncbi:MAG: ABC transporter permease, partial [Planctomycetota bacterium]
MNVFQLVLKQMRQRSLSTVLTVFSVMLGVGLATAVLLMQREADTLLGGDNFGYSVVVGPKGDPLQIVLNNAYGLGSPTSTMQWDAVEQLREDGLATQVVPIAYGDTYDERRIIATEPVMFAGMFEPAEDVVFRIADGENFRADRFEAVVGAEVPMEIGAKFQPVCGDHENPDAHVHAEEWTVVGKAAPTGTVFDRNIYISLPSFFAIPDHGEALNEQALALASTDAHDHAGHDHAGHSHGHDHGHAHDHGHSHDHGSSCASCSSCSSAPSTYVLHADGSFDLLIPEENWRVTAAFVTASGTDAGRIAWRVNNGNLATAAFPGQVMRGFFDRVLLAPSWVIFGVAVLVVIVA